jgi:GTPase SAR1 family protein
MTIQLKKPILIAAVSISFLLWFCQSLQASLNQIGEFSLWGLVFLGLVFWLSKPTTTNSQPANRLSKSIDQTQLEQAFTETATLINNLIKETETFQQINTQQSKESEQIGPGQDLLNQLEQLKTSVSRPKIRVAIAGRQKAGKSSLKQILAVKNISPDLDFLEGEDLLNNFNNRATAINKLSLEFDLILFIINGDLTDSEWQILQEINHHNQQILLIFNQKDRYIPEEQTLLLKQLQYRVKSIITSQDVIAISTNPSAVKVRKYQGDGIIKESLEKPQAELNQLFIRLQEIVTEERQQLVLATTYRQAITLQTEAKNRLNQIRRQQALPIIEQYQWMAAAAAFANPVSSLDLLATAAINTQMLLDLSRIYQQKFSFSQAQTASLSLAKLMAKLGLVEISTQTIASMLKSNAITYVAGGVIQGVSAAYLTRIGGLSLMEYFQVQETAKGESLNLEKLKQKLQAIFQENQRTTFLQNFVKIAVAKL